MTNEEIVKECCQKIGEIVDANAADNQQKYHLMFSLTNYLIRVTLPMARMSDTEASVKGFYQQSLDQPVTAPAYMNGHDIA